MNEEFIFDRRRYELQAKIIEAQEREIELLKEVIQNYKNMIITFDKALKPSLN